MTLVTKILANFFSDGSVLAPCFEIYSHLSWNRSHELVLLASDGICHCNGCNEPSSQRRSRLLCGRDFLPLCFVDFFTLWLRDFCFHFVSRFRRRWRLAGGTGEIWFGRDTFSSLCWPLSSLWPAWRSSSWSEWWPWWSSDIGGTRWKSRLSRDPLLLFPS